MANSMIDGTFDIINRYQQDTVDNSPYINHTQLREEQEKQSKDRGTLSFTDMLSLMVAQFQNQTIDNQADTSDMMNQLVQMSSMQAMTEMTSQMKELALANVMAYSASLVGQYVTLGVYDSEGNLHEIYDKVEASGTYDGQQVIFVGGQSYLLSSIMAVGKIPPLNQDQNPDGEGGETQPTTP